MVLIKKEFSIFVLLVSIFLVSSKPYQRSKRSIVKDYINPLTYPTTKVRFEKGEDGKFHPHLIDSKVEYALAQNIHDLNSVAEDALKSTDSSEDDTKKQKQATEDLLKELDNKTVETPLKLQTEAVVTKTQTFLTETPKLNELDPSKPDKKLFPNESEDIAKNSQVESTYTLVKQEDHNLQFQPKPDGKDDQPFELEPIPPPEYLPRTPDKKEWTGGEGKLIIGQIPFFKSMPFFSGVVPVFMPERMFSLGIVSKKLPNAFNFQDRLPAVHVDQDHRQPPAAFDIQDRLPAVHVDQNHRQPPAAFDIQDRLPAAHVDQDHRLPTTAALDIQDKLPAAPDHRLFPPALDVQDRLPMSDAEVLEEGSETAVIENIDPVTGVLRGERRTETHMFRSPFGPDFPFPISTMRKSVKDLMGGPLHSETSKAQIVDVMGKKMLLQNKVLKYPTDDSSHLYVGVMSVKPLEEVNPETLKKLGLGKEIKGGDKTHRETEDNRKEILKEKHVPEINIDQVPINLSEEIKGQETDVKKYSEKDLLKVEESRKDDTKELSQDIAAQASAIPETEGMTVKEHKLDENSEIKKAVIAQATEITSVTKAVVKNSGDVLKLEESKLNEKNVMSDSAMAKTTEKENVEDKIKDGSSESSEEETKGYRGMDEKRKIVDQKNVMADSMAEGKSKTQEQTAKVSKDTHVDSVTSEDEKLIKENTEREKYDMYRIHDILMSSEIEDDDYDDDKNDFKPFDFSLENRSMKIEEIDLTKEDGVLFAESKKKKLSGKDKKSISKLKRKVLKDKDIDSDSEDKED